MTIFLLIISIILVFIGVALVVEEGTIEGVAGILLGVVLFFTTLAYTTSDSPSKESNKNGPEPVVATASAEKPDEVIAKHYHIDYYLPNSQVVGYETKEYRYTGNSLYFQDESSNKSVSLNGNWIVTEYSKIEKAK